MLSDTIVRFHPDAVPTALRAAAFTAASRDLTDMGLTDVLRQGLGEDDAVRLIDLFEEARMALEGGAPRIVLSGESDEIVHRAAALLDEGDFARFADGVRL
jgi:hypothetical protein